MEFSIKQNMIALVLVAASSTAVAIPTNQLVTWDADTRSDSRQSGTLGNVDVTINSILADNLYYETQFNGGTTTNMDWSGVEAFADIAPQWNAGSDNRAAVIEWATSDTLFVEVTFSQEVTNPVLFFTGLGGQSGRGQDFAFDFSAVLNILAAQPSDGAFINESNNHLVTIDGSHGGSYDNGVAVEMEGTFSSLFFLANAHRDLADSALFTLGATIDDGSTDAFSPSFAGAESTIDRFAFASVGRSGTALAASSVPEPAPFAMFLAGALALVVARRRVA